MPKKRKNRIHGGRILLVLILLAIVGVAGYGYFCLRPVGDSDKEVAFEIEQAQTLDQVLKDMEKEGRIRNATVAKLYAKISGHQDYYAGKFILKDSMSVSDILEHISNPANARSDQFTLTVPEGHWAKEIAEQLAKNLPYTEKEIIAQWNDMDYIKELSKDYSFIEPKNLANKDLMVKLEGYLFPNTYFVNSDATIDEVTRMMLDQFNFIYDTHKEAFDKSKYSIEELVTLASIVQFESGTTEDMPTIAGVFYNRLNKGMKLQSSVTVCYALYDEFDSPEDCETKVDIDSPYNTYKVKGLPAGPILNPGEDAILAVLEPEDNEYLFFVADIHNVKSNPGKVYYSKTYEEHQKLIEELNLIIE